MLKALIIRGSPHDDGNSSTLARYFADGLRDRGVANIEEFNLYGMDLFPCRGCRYCQTAPDAGCAIRDDMSKVYEAWQDADCIVIATPVFWWHVTGPVKTLLDRMTPLQYRDDPIHLKGKQLVLILSFGFDSPTGNQLVMKMFEDIAQWGGMSFLNISFCSSEGKVSEHPEKLLEARELGWRLGLGLKD